MGNTKHARRENHAIVDRKTVSHDVRLGTGGALTRRPNATNGTWLMGGTAGVQEQQGAGGAHEFSDRQAAPPEKEGTAEKLSCHLCVCSVCREGPSSTTHQASFFLFLVTRNLDSWNTVSQLPLERERANPQTRGPEGVHMLTCTCALAGHR